jgi:PAS domain S-box-containing protein
MITAGLLAPWQKVDLQFLFLVCCTIGLGSRITVQIPRVKSHISVSDTFIFLTLLLYGGELAIPLAAMEAAVSSWRFCSRKITVFFNAGAMAVSTTAVVLALTLSGLSADGDLHGRAGGLKNFVIVLSLIALTQFAVNTTLATVHDRLKIGLPLWETWKNKYIWTFITYFVGVLGAGALVQLSDTLGLGMLIAVLPVILFVFLTYRIYLNNVEMSMSQKEQAEQYAGALEEQAVALRESEERFRSAFDYAPIGIALVGLDGQWLKVNRALCEILGYEENDLLETNLQTIIFPEDLPATLVCIGEVAAGSVPSSQMEHRYIHRSGRTVWASWSVSSASDFESGTRNLIFQVQDITDRKVAEERLHFDATHDALTGLANRALFLRQLSTELRRSRTQTGHRVSVLFIDLDRFKNVNDSPVSATSSAMLY